MTVLKKYNDSTAQWEPIVVGRQGSQGATGDTGPQGPAGNDGAFSSNYVINGNFSVNQRQVISGTPTTASPTYIIDRWRLRDGNSTTHTLTLLEAENITGLGVSNALKISNFNNSAWVGQHIEIANHTFLSGKDVAVSFYAKADSPISDLNVFLHAVDDGGSHGSPKFAEDHPIGTTWQRYSFTMTIGTLANDQSTGSLLLGFGQQNTDTTFYLAGVQLELGTTATEFQHRPYSEELRLCQRYYVRWDANVNLTVFPWGKAIGSTAAEYYALLPVPMRTKPTGISFSSNMRAYDGISSAPTITSITIDEPQQSLVGFRVNTSGLTTGELYKIITQNAQTGFIAVEDELT